MSWAREHAQSDARQDAHLELARGGKLLAGIRWKDKSAQVCMIEGIMSIMRTSGIQYIRTHMQLGRRGLTCTSSSLALECAK